MATPVHSAAPVMKKKTASSTANLRRIDHSDIPREENGEAGLAIPASHQARPDSPREKGSGSDRVDRFTPAKRTRYAKNGSVKFQMLQRTCFKGGFLQKPVVLNTTDIHGTEMLKVAGREEWLCQAATGKMERRGAFERGVSRVRVQIKEAMFDASSLARQQKVNAASAGRNLLDLAADSDSSTSSEESADLKKARVVNPSEGTLETVTYRDITFKAAAIKKRMYVEPRADVAQTIVEACLEQTVNVVEEETREEVEGLPPAPHLASLLGEDQPEALEEPLGPRVAKRLNKCVRFDTKRSCYEISYVIDADGEQVKRRCIKGLQVKLQKKGGVRFTPERCEVEMSRCFEKAKKLWNEMDQSDRKRFE